MQHCIQIFIQKKKRGKRASALPGASACKLWQDVTEDSHGGGLITVTEPCPGGLDTRDPVRDTEWQDRWLARD